VNKKNLLKHLLFWVISSIVLFRLFTINVESSRIDYYYTFLFQIPLLIVVFLNYKLADYTLDKKKYFLYLIGFICLLGIGILLHYLVLDYLADYIFSGFLFFSIYSKFELGQYILIYLLVSLLWKFAIDWFEIKENQLQIEKTQNNFLKAQLNPHFLFNCLNNIYGQLSIDTEQGRESIIKLSDALRYMLYKTNTDQVPLKSELEYLENYIELEKLRLETTENLIINFHDNNSELQIAPLILLPFVENCFKHCDKADPKIEIKINTENNKLHFSSRNNILQNPHKEDGGVGLSNAKIRLAILYKDNYILTTDDDGNFYTANLIINLNE